MKKILLALLLLFASGAAAQYTTVSFTMVDTDSQAWFSANWKIDFRPNPSQPNESAYRLINGQPLSSTVTHQNGITNSSGFASISVYDSTLVAPQGSGWTLTLCPKASVQCGVFQFTSAGSTMDLSSRLTTSLAAPRFIANGAGSYGYIDVEAMVQISIGGCYWNVTTNQQRCWDGTEFVVANQGPTGPAGPAGPQGPTGTPGPPGGSLSYPNVTSNSTDGLAMGGVVLPPSFLQGSIAVPATYNPNQAIDVVAAGAKGDGRASTTGTCTSGSPVINVVAGSFFASDVGKIFIAYGCGAVGPNCTYTSNGTTVTGTVPSGSCPLVSTVISQTSSAVTLADNAGTTVTSTVSWAIGTDDHDAIMRAQTQACSKPLVSYSTGCLPLKFPRAPAGQFYLTRTLLWQGLSMSGEIIGSGSNGMYGGPIPSVIRGMPGQDVWNYPDPNDVATTIQSKTPIVQHITWGVDGSIDVSAQHPHRKLGRTTTDVNTTAGSSFITSGTYGITTQSGTVSTTLGSTTVTGVGTTFTSLNAGNQIIVNGEARIITTKPTINTSATTGAWANTNTNAAWSSSSSTVVPGSVSTTAGGTLVTGTSSQFTLYAISIGNQIVAGGETHTITSIISDTQLTTDPWTNTNTNTPWTVNKLGNSHIGCNAGDVGQPIIITYADTTSQSATMSSCNAPFGNFINVAGTLAANGVAYLTGAGTNTITTSTSPGGTITTTASGTTVTGSGTNFNTTLKVGWQVTANGETHTIASIASATSLTTDAWTNLNSGVAWTVNSIVGTISVGQVAIVGTFPWTQQVTVTAVSGNTITLSALNNCKTICGPPLPNISGVAANFYNTFTASESQVGSQVYIPISNATATQTVGNCALGVDNRDGLTTNWKSPISQVQILFTGSFRDMTISSNAGNNTCGFFMQGIAGTAYDQIWDNVRITGPTYGLLEAMPYDTNPLSTGGFGGDFSKIHQFRVGSPYPIVIFNGQAWKIDQVETGAGGAVQILGAWSSAYTAPLIFDVQLPEQEQTAAGAVGFRIEGNTHTVHNMSTSAGTTFGGTIIAWDANGSRCINCFPRALSQYPTSTWAQLLMGGHHNNIDLTDSSGVWQIADDATFSNQITGVWPASGSMQWNRLVVLNTMRSSKAQDRTADFLTDSPTAPYLNREDLVVWPRDMRFNGGFAPSYGNDPGSFSGAYAIFPINVGWVGTNAWPSNAYQIGTNLPAAKVGITLQVKCPTLGSFTFGPYVSATSGGASVFAFPVQTVTCKSTWAVVTLASIDLSAYNGQYLNITFNEAGEVDLGWFAFQPVPNTSALNSSVNKVLNVMAPPYNAYCDLKAGAGTLTISTAGVTSGFTFVSGDVNKRITAYTTTAPYVPISFQITSLTGSNANVTALPNSTPLSSGPFVTTRWFYGHDDQSATTNGGVGTGIQGAFNDSAGAARVQIPAGTCLTSTITWKGQQFFGAGVNLTYLQGMPGQDVIAMQNSLTSASWLGGGQVGDLTILVDTSVDTSNTAAGGNNSMPNRRAGVLQNGNPLTPPIATGALSSNAMTAGNNLAGTISTTAGSGAVVGVGTSFTSLAVGSQIVAGGETHTIASVTNATNLTTDNWTNTNTGITFSAPYTVTFTLSGAPAFLTINLTQIPPNRVIGAPITIQGAGASGGVYSSTIAGIGTFSGTAQTLYLTAPVQTPVTNASGTLLNPISAPWYFGNAGIALPCDSTTCSNATLTYRNIRFNFVNPPVNTPTGGTLTAITNANHCVGFFSQAAQYGARFENIYFANLYGGYIETYPTTGSPLTSDTSSYKDIDAFTTTIPFVTGNGNDRVINGINLYSSGMPQSFGPFFLAPTGAATSTWNINGLYMEGAISSSGEVARFSSGNYNLVGGWTSAGGYVEVNAWTSRFVWQIANLHVDGNLNTFENSTIGTLVDNGMGNVFWSGIPPGGAQNTMARRTNVSSRPIREPLGKLDDSFFLSGNTTTPYYNLQDLVTACDDWYNIYWPSNGNPATSCNADPSGTEITKSFARNTVPAQGFDSGTSATINWAGTNRVFGISIPQTKVTVYVLARCPGVSTNCTFTHKLRDANTSVYFGAGAVLSFGSSWTLQSWTVDLSTSTYGDILGWRFDTGTNTGTSFDLAMMAFMPVRSDSLNAPAWVPQILYSAAGTPLPPCNVANVGNKGMQATVSDATSPTYMGLYNSGGAVTAAVICSYNGTIYQWLTH